ncbi:uncharacterized protein LOC130510542 [Raphanus sativus]|uniref:Uncharacterized protein LOC130510542 n=1 Tax=Raphanus sativus TaxID=3726 RepID=A0A9W3DGB1_RAPSA|nr:uncharacterized protein LOC130510542 [Raphanus sativus]
MTPTVELADYILSEELSKKAKENVNLSCQLTAQGLKEKELKKHCDDLKKEKEDMLQILKSNEKIIKENKEELSKVAYQERAMLSTLSNKEKAINELNEALKKHEVEKANLLEQAAAAQDLKDKSIKELNKHCDDLKKEKEDMFEKLESKEKMIKKNKEEYLSKLHEVLENHKQENTYLIEELAAKDKILKEGEEMLPKIIQGSPLQWVHDSIPKCMQTCLAPKGSITGDELGTFMGSLVTTTAYNVTYSNSDLKAFLFWNSLANLIGSMFGQICNNIVTQMSQTDMKKEGAKKIFKIIGKSVFWILLGGLIPMLAGGFIKKYWKRLVVTAATALVVKCGSATLWKLSYQIPTWQPVLIVILGIIGIGIAAGIPHLVKVASEKK